MSKRLDKVDTQEIKLPKSNSDYGDNFNGEEFCTKTRGKMIKKIHLIKYHFMKKYQKINLLLYLLVF